MIYLVTHGKRFNGVNPSLTEEGKAQIERIHEDVLPKIPARPPLVVVGTGKRFLEIYQILSPALTGIPVKHSPFCGSADSMEADNDTVMLASGEKASHSRYLGMIACAGKAFDAWRFLKDLPDGTLLCAGGELMETLGLAIISQKGQLYELDPNTRTGKMIS